jgi:hypothetical protein
MASVSASVTGVPAIGEDNIGDGWDAFSVSGPELRTPGKKPTAPSSPATPSPGPAEKKRKRDNPDDPGDEDDGSAAAKTCFKLICLKPPKKGKKWCHECTTMTDCIAYQAKSAEGGEEVLERMNNDSAAADEIIDDFKEKNVHSKKLGRKRPVDFARFKHATMWMVFILTECKTSCLKSYKGHACIIYYM